MRSHEISNSDDILDSRDVIARIDELESNEERDEDESQELAHLKALADEGEQATSEWPHGETLIRKSHFLEYAQQLVEDIGDLPRNLPSYIEIDWEKTASNLEADYSEIEFDGVSYLIRSA